MKRLLLALTLGVLLVLLVGFGTATAASPLAGEEAGQLATSGQSAGGFAGTAQQGPSNSNTPIRVLSPGDDGSVTQSNTASSDATAANLNGTEQTADQDQTGGSGLQVAGQAAENAQGALAIGVTAQSGATNTNEPVRVGSKGDGGDVEQSNDASSDATAFNGNLTKQSAEQDQQGGDCKCGGAGTQVVGQEAKNEQDAAALSATKQEKPSNSNISVRVLSPGDDGDVSQSNVASSDATAANLNATKQTADQDAAGGSGEQLIGQSAKSDQDAEAVALTEQKAPSNENISVRVLSPGNGGSVSQSNVASSDAEAVNANKTTQDASQDPKGSSCKCESGDTQIIGQSAKNEQEATAISATKQEKPSNKNISVRVLSPGDDGDVSQSNEATSGAAAVNLNGTKQKADQQAEDGGSCKCGSGSIQFIGQSAKNDQDATALSVTKQEKPSNENTPIRVLSKGDNGDVEQSNTASSEALALNLNGTKQEADQRAGGEAVKAESPDLKPEGWDGKDGRDSCKCSGGGLQIIGQSAENEQEAAALSVTKQEKPSNENAPIRVLSKGDNGDVEQSNDASSQAIALNLNGTKQEATQQAGGHEEMADGSIRKPDGWDGKDGRDGCKCGGDGLQLIGQSAESDQKAIALSATIQEKPSNENSPIRVLSKGDNGDVEQSNTASSDALAVNLNGTKQKADQESGGSGIQVIGQESKSGQFALGAALTAQLGASNENAPVRVLSRGDDGSVTQSNDASSSAVGANINLTHQEANQEQAGGNCCGSGIQAIGQSAKNWQGAKAIALTFQLGSKEPCGCKDGSGFGNSNSPIRVKSKGDGGDVEQSNDASSYALAANANWTKQHANQLDGSDSCGCKKSHGGIQAIGQESKNHQFAAGLAATFQLGAANKLSPHGKEQPRKAHEDSQDAMGPSVDEAGSDAAAGSNYQSAK
jgi:hypothetical protein